ncbi:MAG: SUMF1/EgtB/PvdO family nonheme iron enzyme [Chloroflexota bacterium]
MILPDPFEWIYIPGGTVRLKFLPNSRVNPTIVEIESFHIAKYLITNAQYMIYVKETGRTPERSHHWDNGKFNQPLQPIIDLRWQEAMLFCQWLSAKAGYLITLPTTAQWQRAAQGDDDRRYPWGDDWDPSRCNVEKSQIGHTTPVTQYPQGASLYGMMDAIGNAFQWCLTNGTTGLNSVDWEITETKLISEARLMDETRIFRGISFSNSTGRFPLTSYGATPIFWPYVTGIRLITG